MRVTRVLTAVLVAALVAVWAGSVTAQESTLSVVVKYVVRRTQESRADTFVRSA